MKQIIKVIVYVVSYSITFLLGILIPKNKHIVLFGANYGLSYRGNSKTLFEHMLNNSKYKVYYMIRDKKKLKEFGHKNANIKYLYSIQSIFIFLRSKTICVTNGYADFIGYAPNPWQNWVYLGHGVGTKSLGYLSKNTTIQQKIRMKLMQRMYFIVTSDFDKFMFSAMYMHNPQKIIVAGYPRTDSLFIEEKDKENTMILFAPTYRSEGVHHLFGFNDENYQDIQSFLVKNNINLHIRFHPSNSVEPDTPIASFLSMNNIINLNSDVVDDIQSFLPKMDILITDYSSISRDFLLLDRPIIFITNNLEKSKHISLPIREEFAFCGYRVKTLRELFNAIQEILTGKDKYRELRNFVKLLTYNYVDNHSCDRITELIDKWNHL